jgi:hypothetical protein
MNKNFFGFHAQENGKMKNKNGNLIFCYILKFKFHQVNQLGIVIKLIYYNDVRYHQYQ